MGNVVLLGIRAETNLSFANVDAAGLPDFSRSNYSCRIYGNVRGGRGGGVAIFARHSAPCVSRYDVFAAVQRELYHKFCWCEPTARKYPPALSASTWANPISASPTRTRTRNEETSGFRPAETSPLLPEAPRRILSYLRRDTTPQKASCPASMRPRHLIKT